MGGLVDRTSDLRFSVWRLTDMNRYAFAIFEESLTTESFLRVNDVNAYTKTIPTFLTLYIFGMIYQLVLVWDALRLKNTIQVIGLCMLNVGLLIYAGVQWDQLNTATDMLQGTLSNQHIWEDLAPYLIAIPCVLGLGTILMSVVAWRLYDEFAWTIYKHISADLRMKRRYLTFQVSFYGRCIVDNHSHVRRSTSLYSSLTSSFSLGSQFSFLWLSSAATTVSLA